MPTYEYRCQACGHEMEAFQSIKDAPLKDCPACKQSALERLISAGNFILKGGGWYKDLYSSNKPGGSSSGSHVDKSDRLTKAIDDKKKESSSGSGGGNSDSPTPSKPPNNDKAA